MLCVLKNVHLKRKATILIMQKAGGFTGEDAEIPSGANGFYVSDDPLLLNTPIIYKYLSQESYWSKNVPLQTVQRSIENSLCFGVYETINNQQVGFGRIVSDRAT